MTYQISDASWSTTEQVLDALRALDPLSAPSTTMLTLRRGSILVTISLTVSHVA